MFAGAGDFFRPVMLRSDVAPVQGPAGAGAAGDGGHDFRSLFGPPPRARADEESGAPRQEEENDSIEMTLAALQALLTGSLAPAPAAPAPSGALGAYLRAAEAAPAPASPAPETSLAVPEQGGAGEEIFYMLAALEKAGQHTLVAQSGETLYDALRARCRALDIPLPPPTGKTP